MKATTYNMPIIRGATKQIDLLFVNASLRAILVKISFAPTVAPCCLTALMRNNEKLKPDLKIILSLKHFLTPF